MHQDDSDSLVVELGAAGSAHHLQNICHWEIDVPLGLSIIVLRPLDHD